MRRLAVLDAPSNLGLMPPKPGVEPGVRHLPDALRNHRLLERIGAMDAGRVEAPTYSPEIEPSGVRNGLAIREFSFALAERVGELLASDTLPLVLGGDCSILLGTMLALKKRGRFGLAFVDGHADFLTPDRSATKGVAGMDLAIATGRGPDLLAAMAGVGSLVDERAVVAIGYRGVGSDAAGADELRRTGATVISLEELRAIDLTAAASQTVATFEQQALDGFWIHVDVDVLDSSMMPAVDSPQPHGLSYDELAGLLQPLLASRLATGMQVTIFDPDLDPAGTLARRIVGTIVDSFSSWAAEPHPSGPSTAGGSS
jgi:arginase